MNSIIIEPSRARGHIKLPETETKNDAKIILASGRIAVTCPRAPTGRPSLTKFRCGFCRSPQRSSAGAGAATSGLG